MLLDLLDYHLPTDLIAQVPPPIRSDSRLLTLSRSTGALADRGFPDLPNLLHGNELLVVNNVRVLPARLFGTLTSKPDARATPVEVFLARHLSGDTWEALVKPGRKLPVGAQVVFGHKEEELHAEILSTGERGLRTLRFQSRTADSVAQHFESLGHIPLPPYIKRPDSSSDRQRYQTIFAKSGAAVAAPTAGLHFTPEILQAIRNTGAEICELTLDVGLGTFLPIRSDSLEGHVMHAESYEISGEVAEKICAAKAVSRPIVAIGTTSVRALEAAALRAAESSSKNLLDAGRADARLFMTPGFPFRVIDALLTNFHLPRSTLLALVCAFAGSEHTMAAYRHAVHERYRFYSYGDCMLIR